MRSSLFRLLLLAFCLHPVLADGQEETLDAVVGVGGRNLEGPLNTERLGYLKRNQTNRDNPAPYVLTDRRGTIRYYVTTKQNMDLEPYLNQYVAIHGDAYQRAHRFEVDEIVPMDTKLLPPLGQAPLGHAPPSDPEAAQLATASRRPARRKADMRAPRGGSFATADEAASAELAEPGLLAPGLLEDQLAGNEARRPRRLKMYKAIRRIPLDVTPTAHQEEIETPSGVDEGPSMMAEPEFYESGEIVESSEGYIDGGMPETLEFGNEFAEGSCCGLGMCDTLCGPCGAWECYWVRGEYLLWWTEGMRTPPLVTTSPDGTARADAGVLGEPGTSILFGGNRLDHDPHSGFRIRVGTWLNDARTVGLEADYWGLETQSASFQASSTGSPILARPFYDAVAGQETAELVAFPNVLTGTVTVDAPTELSSAGARLVISGCCSTCDFVDPCDPCTTHPRYQRIDWLPGYRYMELNESLSIREDLVSTDTANPGSFVVRDRFDTRNQFNGGEIGILCTSRRCCWTTEFLSRIAVGNNSQQVTISGSTDLTQPGAGTTTATGGLLAQRTNIGTYERDQLSVIPELGVTFGCQITPRLRCVLGYTFIYWSNVVRPGDQIDTDVNPNLLPPENPTQTTHLRPEFAFRDSDIWIQGLNAGLDFRW